MHNIERSKFALSAFEKISVPTYETLQSRVKNHIQTIARIQKGLTNVFQTLRKLRKMLIESGVEVPDEEDPLEAIERRAQEEFEQRKREAAEREAERKRQKELESQKQQQQQQAQGTGPSDTRACEGSGKESSGEDNSQASQENLPESKRSHPQEATSVENRAEGTSQSSGESSKASTSDSSQETPSEERHDDYRINQQQSDPDGETNPWAGPDPEQVVSEQASASESEVKVSKEIAQEQTQVVSQAPEVPEVGSRTEASTTALNPKSQQPTPSSTTKPKSGAGGKKRK